MFGEKVFHPIVWNNADGTIGITPILCHNGLPGWLAYWLRTIQKLRGSARCTSFQGTRLLYTVWFSHPKFHTYCDFKHSPLSGRNSSIRFVWLLTNGRRLGWMALTLVQVSSKVASSFCFTFKCKTACVIYVHVLHRAILTGTCTLL